MKTIVPEFSRPLEIARVPATGCHERLNAEPLEREALSVRLKLPALHSVSAHLHIQPWRGGGLKVTGEVTADLEQISVISLEAFRQEIKFAVERYFVPKLPEGEEQSEDIDILEGETIDLGEIAAETLALELDPYPRKPGEAFAPTEYGDEILSAKISPFAALGKLKGGKP